jgi:hypothetical protein
MVIIKKMMIVGLVGTTIFSLKSMEESKKESKIPVIKYSPSWTTPVLVINEFLKNKNMPKDIANNIFSCMWRSELSPTPERVHWVIQLNQQLIGNDKTSDLLHIRAMFLNKKDKEALTLLTDAIVRDELNSDGIFVTKYTPLEQTKYKEILAIPSLVNFRKELYAYDNRSIMVKESKMMEQIVSGGFCGNSAISASMYGGVAGAVLYCYLRNRLGANFSFGMGMTCFAIGAGTLGASTLLGNLLVTRAYPPLGTKEVCRYLLTEEELNKNAVSVFYEKINADNKNKLEQFFKDKKEESKNNFLLQNLE